MHCELWLEQVKTGSELASDWLNLQSRKRSRMICLWRPALPHTDQTLPPSGCLDQCSRRPPRLPRWQLPDLMGQWAPPCWPTRAPQVYQGQTAGARGTDTPSGNSPGTLRRLEDKYQLIMSTSHFSSFSAAKNHIWNIEHVYGTHTLNLFRWIMRTCSSWFLSAGKLGSNWPITAQQKTFFLNKH